MSDRSGTSYDQQKMSADDKVNAEHQPSFHHPYAASATTTSAPGRGGVSGDAQNLAGNNFPVEHRSPSSSLLVYQQRQIPQPDHDNLYPKDAYQAAENHAIKLSAPEVGAVTS